MLSILIINQYVTGNVCTSDLKCHFSFQCLFWMIIPVERMKEAEQLSNTDRASVPNSFLHVLHTKLDSTPTGSVITSESRWERQDG